MKKVLVGVKHREALESFRLINLFNTKNNWDFELSLIIFFPLQQNELEDIKKEGIEVISSYWNLPLITEDNKMSKVKKFYLNFVTYRILEKELNNDYDCVVVSPGGFLLDQLIAFAIVNNIPSFLLQNGFMLPLEFKKTNSQKSLFGYKLLAPLSNFIFSRLMLKSNREFPKYLTIGKEYCEHIISELNSNTRAISVGNPRFFNLETGSHSGLSPKPKILYLTSSAIYEKRIDLHELGRKQILEIIKETEEENIDFYIRPHPRDLYDWTQDKITRDIKILDSSVPLLEQILDYDFMVAERSTAILQAILLGKVGYWISLDEERRLDYDHICHNSVSEMLLQVKKVVNDKELFFGIQKNQRTIVNNLVESSGEMAAHNIIDAILDSNFTYNSEPNFNEYLEYLKLIG